MKFRLCEKFISEIFYRRNIPIYGIQYRIQRDSIYKNKISYMCYCFVYRREFLSPLDLPSLLQESLLLSRIQSTISSSSRPHTAQHVFWKLAFIYQNHNNLTPSDSRIMEWLYHKLQFQPRSGNDDSTHTPLSSSEDELQTLSLSSSPLLSQAGASSVSLPVAEGEESGTARQLCLAIKGCCDEILWREDEAVARELCGTCAVAIFLPTPQYADQTAEV